MFYYSGNYWMFVNDLESKIKFWDVLMSYITWFFWFIFVIWIIWIFNKLTDYFIKKFFGNNTAVIFISDFIIRFIAITRYIIAFYVFTYFSIIPISVKDIVHRWYSIAIILTFTIFATSFVNKFFAYDLIEKSKLKALSRNLLPFVNKIIVWFIWVIWAITIFDNLWYNISALIAWAWIWGLAIAFAAQKSIWNVFGAITILLNKPFKIWDYVTVNGVTWVVKDIGLSYLTLIERAGHQVMIPNETIISTNVENFSVRRDRRTDFSIWLVFWTTLEKMKVWVKIIEDILDEYVTENTISEHRVFFNMFNSFSLDINVTYYSLLNDSYADYLKQKEEINLKIKTLFKQARLEMAFPTQQLYIKNEK